MELPPLELVLACFNAAGSSENKSKPSGSNSPSLPSAPFTEQPRQLNHTGQMPSPGRPPRKVQYFFNKDYAKCVVPTCRDVVHSVWYFRDVPTEAGKTERIWMGGGLTRKTGESINGGQNKHKLWRQTEKDAAGKAIWEKAGRELLVTGSDSASGTVTNSGSC